MAASASMKCSLCVGLSTARTESRPPGSVHRQLSLCSCCSSRHGAAPGLCQERPRGKDGSAHTLEWAGKHTQTQPPPSRDGCFTPIPAQLG
ncbi:hypothetical protein DV515_00014375 [Chloebia gouldiae]|nr:hypothetical protein DV515_00014375 [Chloebia gouldiae]